MVDIFQALHHYVSDTSDLADNPCASYDRLTADDANPDEELHDACNEAACLCLALLVGSFRLVRVFLLARSFIQALLIGFIKLAVHILLSKLHELLQVLFRLLVFDAADSFLDLALVSFERISKL